MKSKKRKQKGRDGDGGMIKHQERTVFSESSSTPEDFLRACQLHQAGLLPEARMMYEKSLQSNPQHIDSWRNLGGLLRQQGRAADALQCVEKAIHLNSSDAGLWGNAGNALRDLNRLEESEQAFRKACKLCPDGFGQLLGLAITLNKSRKHWDAIQLADMIGINAKDEGESLADLMLEIGNAYHCVQRKNEALSYWQQAVERCKGEKQLLMVLNIAQVLCENGRHAEAEALLRNQFGNHSKSANLHYAVGVCNKGLGKWEEAIEWFEKALLLDPQYKICLNTYGLLLRDIGRIHQARACFEKALEIDEEFGAAMNNLGSVLKDVARYDEALTWLRKSAKIMNNNPAAHSNVLFTLFGYELENKDKRLREAQEYGDLYTTCKHERWKDRVLVPDALRRLRIGFISPDFCRHAVSYFIEPILEQLDRKDLHITLYACGSVRDDYTARLQGKCEQWRDVGGLPLEGFVLQILRDEIDILIDLAGHTAGNRLDLMCQKPAPIQATYLGYYGTTGCKTIDYWLTDHVIHPSGADVYDPSTERKWPLNRPYLCYRPLADAPNVSESPALKNGYITFGSFNQSRKITNTTVEKWMKVLKCIPSSKLMLKSKNLAEPTEEARIRNLFLQHGLTNERLILRGHSPTVEAHLEAYSNVDVCLDTYPYTGCTTTADALWMGVPVLTIAGRTMVSRQAAAVLAGGGCENWICGTNEELVQKAVKLTRDHQELGRIRKQLRSKISRSQLLDHKGMARELEKTFRSWWHSWLDANQWTVQSWVENPAWPSIVPRRNWSIMSPYPR